jgi:branched-chain amino acid transport system ATP-binding protein
MAGTGGVDGGGAALDLDGVTVDFGGLRAVDHVSMTVGTGERWGVIGPNGAGKTTLFRTISGEVMATGGSVALFGKDVTRMAPYRRAHRGIGRTYQVTNLFLGLTVVENLTIAAQALSPARWRSWWPVQLRGELKERIDGALEQVDLADRRDRLVSELSHGEQRQLELAMGLAGRPKVLLLDEPAAGLSAGERVLMRTLIERLPEDLAVVLIEHDMGLVLELVDRVLVLDNGRPIATGTPEEISADEDVQAVYLRSD